METKQTQKITSGKFPYETPRISLEKVTLEYSVAAGSVQVNGTVEQQWDAEESVTSSQSQGWW